MHQPLSFERVRAMLIDLDGVLYRGNTALPGASAFIAFLRQQRIRFRLITNNATLTPQQYVAKLAGLDIHVEVEEVFTSALATGLYLERQGAHGESAYVIGEDGLRAALAGLQMRITDNSPQWVVVGLDRNVTYSALATASLAVQQGARFVGSNPDLSFPNEAGLVPGAGALQGVIAATTGVRPIVVGKPEPLMFQLAMEDLGTTAETTMMLGDRLDTDIAGAQSVGLPSILVLTGVSTRADLAESSFQPSRVVDSLPQLVELMSASRTG